MMFERRIAPHLDWPLLGAVLLLAIVGVAMIYSITGGEGREAGANLHINQLYAIGLGLVGMLVCLGIDYRRLTDNSHLIYLLLLVALVYVLLFGTVSKGAQRWISLGGFTLQPAEFTKLGVALVLAKFLGESERRGVGFSQLLIAGGIAVSPAVLIYQQPDLGTAVTLGVIFVGVAFVAGLPLRVLGIVLIAVLAVSPLVWTWGMKPYQKERIVTFLDPERDPQGTGYQQIQARVTSGSGGLWGKGFTQGTQGQFRFLPEAQTDFVFSVLAEELGFAGVIAVLGLYLFVIMRSVDAARLAKDRTGTYLVIGVLASFAFQVVYCVTMSAGLAPVKGLPLPLMSYGGSSVMATLAGFGLILNVRMRRFTN